MVDPDASAVLDCDAVVVYNLADGKVAENDIGRIHNRDSEARDFCALSNTDDGLEKVRGNSIGSLYISYLVATGTKTLRQVEIPLGVDNLWLSASNG